MRTVTVLLDWPTRPAVFATAYTHRLRLRCLFSSGGAAQPGCCPARLLVLVPVVRRLLHCPKELPLEPYIEGTTSGRFRHLRWKLTVVVLWRLGRDLRGLARGTKGYFFQTRVHFYASGCFTVLAIRFARRF